MSSDDLRRMRAHIRELLREHGIKARTGNPLADRAAREVRFPVVRGHASYLTALHEIGHVIGRGCWAKSGLPAEVMRSEEATWLWALKRSVVRPHWTVYRGIYESLLGYDRALG